MFPGEGFEAVLKNMASSGMESEYKIEELMSKAHSDKKPNPYSLLVGLIYKSMKQILGSIWASQPRSQMQQCQQELVTT